VRDISAGVLLGVFGVFLVSAISLFFGFFSWRDVPALGSLGRIVLTAGAVSLVEEAVFRGVILGICLWNLSARGAIAVSSALFAVVHFLKPAKTRLAPEAVQWSSGYTELFSFAGALPSSAVLFFGLASLFVAGWILGRATLRTHSLWLPIGLHAGWVFGVQTSNLFLRSTSSEPTGFLPWVGPSLVSGAVPTGLLPLAGLLLAGWLVRLYLKHVFRPAVA
jgi:membrane protease YdiL (CAAX protease family)